MFEGHNLSTLEILNGVMQIYNYRDTSGIVFLKSGLALRIPFFYDFFQEEWVEYKIVIASKDEEKIKKYMEEKNGGVISNGTITLYIPDVIAMIKEQNGETINIFGSKQGPQQET